MFRNKMKIVLEFVKYFELSICLDKCKFWKKNGLYISLIDIY